MIECVLFEQEQEDELITFRLRTYLLNEVSRLDFKTTLTNVACGGVVGYRRPDLQVARGCIVVEWEEGIRDGGKE